MLKKKNRVIVTKQGDPDFGKVLEVDCYVSGKAIIRVGDEFKKLEKNEFVIPQDIQRTA